MYKAWKLKYSIIGYAEARTARKLSRASRVSVTASAKRLYRDIEVEELVPWIWSGTNHHNIRLLCPPKDSRSRGSGTVLKDALRPVPVCNS